MILPSHLQWFSINVWSSICRSHLLGPHVLPNRLIRWNYKASLENNVPDFLAGVPLTVDRELHLMHDGAPTHFSPFAYGYLNWKFPSRCIGRGGSIACPPHSPDSYSLDSYLWDHLKSMVCLSPLDDVETLWN
jgi:hypothetical protein